MKFKKNMGNEIGFDNKEKEDYQRCVLGSPFVSFF